MARIIVAGSENDGSFAVMDFTNPAAPSVRLEGWWLTLAPFVVVGAILRVSALCYLGGNAIKLFELGIVAPALIMGLLHGAPEADRLSRGEPTKGAGFFDLLVTPVYAAEHSISKSLKPSAFPRRRSGRRSGAGLPIRPWSACGS